ncbi:MAG: hypothetical protein NTV88_05720 [Candidatus Micrarchaeota archaeon]|nr:hypothetical protein [Candidatus Micrarchaeota archaeon]
MAIIGKHTAASEKNIQISPFQLTFGHRTRPFEAAKSLGLENVKRHDMTHRGKHLGRTVLLEGDYNYCIKDRTGGERKGKITLALGETQMGFGADEITAYEYAEHAEKIDISRRWGLFQIRVGTALGINHYHEPEIRVGHIVMPKNNVMFGGAALQSCGYTPLIDLSKITPDEKAKSVEFLMTWQKLGGKITKDGRYLVNRNSRPLFDALEIEAKGTGAIYHLGDCFSKDSLYGEDLGYMVELGRTYNIRTSEMEQSMNAYLADKAWRHDKIKIMTGAVLVQIGECWKDSKGKVHGHGFPESKREENAVRVASEKAFAIAANALARMKEKLGNPLLF